MYSEEKGKEEMPFRLDLRGVVRMAEIRVCQKERRALAMTQDYEVFNMFRK